MADHDSTLVRRGSRATTFQDMAEFVDAIGERPLDKLVAELPELAKLSETKFRLASHAIRRRCRTLSSIEQEQLRIFADEVSASADSAIGDRIRGIFTRLVEHPAARGDRDRVR